MLDRRAPILTDANREVVIRVRGVQVGFGERLILKGLDLDVYRGEILGFVGGSGQGKSVLTRTILGLVPKRAGAIEVFGEDLDAYARPELGGMEGGRQPTGPDGHWLEPLTILSVVCGMTERVRLGLLVGAIYLAARWLKKSGRLAS